MIKTRKRGGSTLVFVAMWLATFIYLTVRWSITRPVMDHAEQNGRARLSPRQQEVLGFLSEGVNARAIAARLSLAEPTVRNHIRTILRKLGCHSQLEAVAVARRRGLIE